MAGDRPNIIYLHSHDTGRYIEPYGHAISTPNVQRLAEEGVLFRQAFSAAPTCSPSRAALLTGTYPHENGMLGLTHRGFSLNDYGEHLVRVLGARGYHTALAGLQHVAAEAHQVGYDDVPPVESRRAEHVAPAAVDLIETGLREPFFLDVGFFENHRPFPEPEAADRADYVAVPPPLPDTPATRADMAAYHASVRAMDAGIGAVLAALRARGLDERTLVICTTDHGLPFPHMKCTLTDHGTGVALIMRGPGGFTGGQVVDAMVSQLDLFPTICELTNSTPPQRLRGTSLTPLVRGEVDRLHDELFAEVTFHAAYEPQRSVRTDRWKYIRRFDDRDSRVFANCDPGPSKDLLEASGWGERPQPREQLHDLVFDPQEAHNLAADPAAQQVLARLRARLDRWMEETTDPLTHGPVPAPAGARIAGPDGS